jgi:hypothetical protein
MPPRTPDQRPIDLAAALSGWEEVWRLEKTRLWRMER